MDAVVAAIRVAAPVLRDGGDGSPRSGPSSQRARALPGHAGYAKAAVIGYSKGAARDLGPRGIIVNVTGPVWWRPT
ncbi:SDR family oxidoreductase [Actinomadura rubrisoli]|uniref:SDR family oxidoreductase n=1 Tax=Actinomadura rubrisoli TaxID=2530368 RepID=A0A4R5ARY1_9ACTN|nr:SDR family oxidoreductase [Actinomadura rubrisoli]